MDNPETRTRIQMVCANKQLGSDGKMLLVMYSVVQDTEDAGAMPKLGQKWMFLLDKSMRLFFSGNIYEIDMSGESIYPKSARYIRQWWDHTQIAQWKMETQVQEALHESNQRNKREADDSPLLAALLPYRRQYHSTIGRARQIAIELVVLRALHTPLSREERGKQ